jgi:hypothetical protein
MREELQYRSDLRYEHLSREANQSWKWGAGGQGYLYVADELAEAMSRDPRLRVFAAAGYYDLATPYAAQRHTFDHMPLEPSLRGNLTFIGYASGHMIYTDPAAAAKLRDDVEAFVRCAVDHRCDRQEARPVRQGVARPPRHLARRAPVLSQAISAGHCTARQAASKEERIRMLLTHPLITVKVLPLAAYPACPRCSHRRQARA